MKILCRIWKFVSSPIVSSIILFVLLEICIPYIFKKFSFLEGTIINGIIVFLIYIFRENLRIKADFTNTLERNIAKLRRIPDPYERFSSETLRKFIEITGKSKSIWTIDRTNPDAWFLNENLLCFLTIQSDIIRKRGLQAHRIFIAQSDDYKKERYKQLLILNVYLGIDTYLIPKNWVTQKTKEIAEFLNNQHANLVNDDNFRIQNEQGSDWINYLCLYEEFLLYVDSSTNGLDGIAKVERVPYQIQHRDLFPIEESVYFNFLKKLIELTKKDNKILSKLDFVDIETIDEEWWKKCSSCIEETISNVMSL